MTVAGRLLILLIPVLSLCGATEYYVRPTEPTNTSCPAQPCLTFSQYTIESDKYFQSNTVFRVLPGTHSMDRPIVIGNVHNISLENFSSERPHLVAEFSCDTKFHHCMHVSLNMRDPYGNDTFAVCCAAVWLHDTYNATVRGISLALWKSNKPMSGVLFKNVSRITIQWTTTHSFTEYISIGFAGHATTFVDVHSSSANNCTYGLVLHTATNTHITNVTTLYNEKVGVALYMANDTYITHTTAAQNGLYGMYLSFMNSTHITNTTAMHNSWYGMSLSDMKDTHITNTSVTHNDGQMGMVLSNMGNIHITNVMAANNGKTGMYLVYMNNTHITSTTVTHNGWDGINLSIMSNTHITSTTAAHNSHNGMDLSQMNSTHITNTTVAYNGRPGMILSNMNNTHITKTTAQNNNRDAQFSTELGQIVLMSCAYTLIYNTSFTNTSTLNTANPADPTTLPAVIVLLVSTVHFSECHFVGNKISAIKARASNITFSDNLTFSNNSAFTGTVFILLQNSMLFFRESAHIHFSNNHASNTGGVFHIANHYPIIDLEVHEMYTCFLNSEESRTQMQFTFVNNSAGKGGDILYGGHVALGWDGYWNCLDSFKNMSNISQNGLSLISSDPSRICLCDDNGEPDCLMVADPKPHVIYPGQTIYLSAVAVCQDFGTVSGSVYAQFLQGGDSIQIESAQNVQGVTQHSCNHLSYTIFAHSDVNKTVLILTAHDSHVSTIIEREHDVYGDWAYTYGTTRVEPLMNINNPVYVNISLLPCPPGFMLTTDTPFRCDCDLLLQHINGFQCHIQEQTIGRSGLLWVGMIQDNNETNDILAASAYCSLDYCKAENSSVTLSDPDSQCNYNHSGVICGGCQPGLSLALGSAQCLQCSNKYLALLIPLTLAGPALVFSIKLLDLTISQGTLNGLIFYANIVKANEYIFLSQRQTNPLTVFIAWLNLDLGVETCLFNGLTAYSKTWLQFVFPLYIWSIAGLIIILAKHSDRVAKVMGNNSVPILATLFLLSYAKLLRTIITALSYTVVYTSHGPKTVWTADGNVDYLGPKHAPLFAVAVTVLLLLWLPYTSLLFLGQWLHKCNYQLINHLLMKIKPFLDAYYGPLKGKHHYWFGALLLLRAAILLISALVPTNRSSVVVLCISVMAVVLTHFGQVVYRNLVVSVFDTSFFMNLTILGAANSFTATDGGDAAVDAYMLIGLAFAQFVGLIIFKLFSILKLSEKVMQCLHKRQHVEDDWELYEEAALLREMESDSDEQESEGSGSIESFPTY